jgi:hypothetical protein
VRLRSEATGRALEAEFDVRGVVREVVGRPARADVMQEIAATTGGRYAAAADLSGLLSELRRLQEPPPVEIRFALWSHPAWGAFILLLLAVYWVGRKLAGLV